MEARAQARQSAAVSRSGVARSGPRWSCLRGAWSGTTRRKPSSPGQQAPEKQPPINSAVIDNPGDRSYRDENDAGWDRFRHRTRCETEADGSIVGAALAHFRKRAPGRPRPYRRLLLRKCRIRDTSRPAKDCSPPRTWPIRLTRKSIIALASPVISISMPRNTNSMRGSGGQMPPACRPGMIDMGVVVLANARYSSFARPNANAMGTPMTMQNTSMPTKKMTRLGRCRQAVQCRSVQPTARPQRSRRSIP